MKTLKNKLYAVVLLICGYLGVYTAPSAYVGGNWNNDLMVGPFYANLNNTASNSNSNNGAALSYP